MTEKQKVELEIKDLREVMSETARTLATIDFQLTPYWHEKGEIEHSIRRTHGRRGDGAILFDPSGASDRVPLFAEMDALTAEWGPIKTDRAQVKSRLAGYERDYKRLTNELKYLTKKEGKNDKGQGTLFN
jgi:hypothetical protein